MQINVKANLSLVRTINSSMRMAFNASTSSTTLPKKNQNWHNACVCQTDWIQEFQTYPVSVRYTYLSSTSFDMSLVLLKLVVPKWNPPYFINLNETINFIW
jgi:hypothetical protein